MFSFGLIGRYMWQVETFFKPNVMDLKITAQIVFSLHRSTVAVSQTALSAEFYYAFTRHVTNSSCGHHCVISVIKAQFGPSDWGCRSQIHRVME